MEYISGKCFTNLDYWDVSSVDKFARVPNIGERVMARNNGMPASLKVVQITHCIDTRSNKPYIVVELHQ